MSLRKRSGPSVPQGHRSLSLAASLGLLLLGSAAAEPVGPTGSVVTVEIQRSLSSATARVGDEARARVVEADASELPTGFVLMGEVTQVTRASRTRPGTLDLTFRASRADGRDLRVLGYLASPGEEGTSGETADTGQRPLLIGAAPPKGAIVGEVLADGRVRGRLLGTEGTRTHTPAPVAGRRYADVTLRRGTRLQVRLVTPAPLAAQSANPLLQNVQRSRIARQAIVSQGRRPGYREVVTPEYEPPLGTGTTRIFVPAHRRVERPAPPTSSAPETPIPADTGKGG